MIRLFQTASRSVASSSSSSAAAVAALRINSHHHHATTALSSLSYYSATTRFLAARHFSDTADAAVAAVATNTAADTDTDVTAAVDAAADTAANTVADTAVDTASDTATDTASDTAANTTASNPAADDDAAVYKVGKVWTFSIGDNYGFIAPDGAKNVRKNPAEMYFVHRNDITKLDVPPTTATTATAAPAPGEKSGEGRFWPILQRGMRVRFRAWPPTPGDGKPSGKATEVTLEDGRLIPPFLPGYLDIYTKRRKASFGEEVFDIFGTSKDQQELETKIVAAYDGAKGDIDRTTAKVKRAEELFPAAAKAKKEE